MIDSTVPVFSLGHAVMRTGLTARRIRYLERQGHITPARTEGTGHRVFSEEDIKRLLRIKGYLDNGYAREKLPLILSMEDGTDKSD